MGKKTAAGLSQMGFETVCCCNDYVSLWESLGEEEFAGVLFFGMLNSDELHGFVVNCHEKYPEMKIYPILLSPSQALHSTLIAEGATHCLTLPMAEYEICDEIVYDFYSDDDLQIIPKIAAFLTKKGFSSMYVGFKFLCYSIEMTVDDPAVLQKITSVLYPTIGEKMNISDSQVDRGLRILKQAVRKKGIYEFDDEADEKLTNKRIIGRLSKEFAESIGFSTERFDGYVD
ncbi:MAG: hypothetical protein J6K77_04485 [Ruminococcus sp.]|nr:hypothetical protein [Ruminococcus sp.]